MHGRRAEAHDRLRVLLKPNTLLDTMKKGNLALVYTMNLAVAPQAVLMAKAAGYTAIGINLEHGKSGTEQTADICCTTLASGLSTIVIVPSLRSDWVSRLLDNGAQAIIIPRCHDAEMAREFVRCSKHRPLGERPLAFCAQLAFQIPSFELAQQAANASCMTIPMIESVKGLENCEPIAAVPGVDALFVGVHDLSDELGIPGDFENPTMQQAIDRICQAAQAASTPDKPVFVGMGGMESHRALFQRWRHKHDLIRFCNAGRDDVMLNEGMARSIEMFRQS